MADCRLLSMGGPHDPLHSEAQGTPMKLVDASLPWFVVRTGVSCEDRAVEALRLAGFDTYLPKMRKDIIHHRKKTLIVKEFVLFNRYLFCAVPLGNFGAARECDGFECFLGVDGKPQRIHGKIVADFQGAEIDQEFDDTKAAKVHRGEIKANEKAQFASMFPEGRRVVVRAGHSLGGFYGQVVKAKGKSKVRAMIRILGGLVPVEFEGADLEPLDETQEAA